jgi:hypothetical protein
MELQKTKVLCKEQGMMPPPRKIISPPPPSRATSRRYSARRCPPASAQPRYPRTKGRPVVAASVLRGRRAGPASPFLRLPVCLFGAASVGQLRRHTVPSHTSLHRERLDVAICTGPTAFLVFSWSGGAFSCRRPPHILCCGPIRSAGEYRSLGARQISIDLDRVEKQWSGARRRLLS